MILRAHLISPGYAEGEALVTSVPFSFIGELDPSTGRIPSPGHKLFGETVAGKVLVCPTGKGSSAAPIVTWQAKKKSNNPAAIICLEAEPIIASAAITAGIPMVDRLEQNPLEVINNGDYVKVNATEGEVEIIAASKV